MRLMVQFVKSPTYDSSTEELTYSDGVWEREVDFENYQVGRSGWFRKRWAVYKFAGADTAALGGGTVWYDRVSSLFETEYEAIKFLMEEL